MAGSEGRKPRTGEGRCAEVIRGARLARGMKQEELAARLQVSRNTVAGWETGHARPDMSLVPDLCDALQISLDTFFGRKRTRSGEERRILDKFFSLEAGDRQVIEWQMDALAERRAEQRRQEWAGRIVTLYRNDLTAAAGFGAPLEDGGGEEIMLFRDGMTEQADEVVTVSGRSMEPTFQDGDRVLVKHADSVREGEIGIFLTDGEGFIKEYTKQGLRSHNPEYGLMRFGDGQTVRCVGKVLGKVRPEQIPDEQQMKQILRAQRAGKGDQR